MKKFHACKINSSIHKIQIKEEKHLSHMGTRFIRKLDFEVESKWRRKRKRRPLSLSAFTICILRSRWHVGPGEAAIMSRAYAYNQVTPSPGWRSVNHRSARWVSLHAVPSVFHLPCPSLSRRTMHVHHAAPRQLVIITLNYRYPHVGDTQRHRCVSRPRFIRRVLSRGAGCNKWAARIHARWTLFR